MTDLLRATNKAFFEALSAGAGLGSVVQHVPENAQPPITVVGDIVAEAIGEKDDDLEQHTVEVIHTYRGEQRSKLYAMAQAGRDAIAAGPLTADGATFGPARWLKTETGIDEDGVTYQAVSTFEVIVQADE